MLGTYQGEQYPSDDELDYETNVEQVAKEKYADYYDENGEVLPNTSVMFHYRKMRLRQNIGSKHGGIQITKNALLIWSNKAPDDD